MRLYKLTNETGHVHQGYFFGETGLEHKKRPVSSPRLCSSDVFHAYEGKNLAFLLNPIHANFETPQLWEVFGEIAVSDKLKVGSFHLRVGRQLKIPKWVGSSYDLKVRVIFAVLCVIETLNLVGLKKEANMLKKVLQKEVNKKNFDFKKIKTAAAAAEAAVWAAAAVRAAAEAAWAALQAAAYAAEAARAARAARAAAAARAAVYAAKEINCFTSLADKAVALATKEV